MISIIIAAHNSGAYISNCIESLLNQSYNDFEILVINDHSSDNTVNIINDWSQKYSFIKGFDSDGVGVSAARNTGIRLSKGEYITFVDSDDIVHPDMLSVLHNMCIREEADIAGCSFRTFSNADEFYSHTAIEDNVKVFTPSAFIPEELLRGNSRCWSKLYKKSSLGNIVFKEGLSIGEDILFLTELMPHIKRIAENSFKGYGYYQNPHGAMNRPFTPQYMDQILCWEEILDRLNFLNDIDKDIYNDCLCKCTQNLIMGIMLVVGKYAEQNIKERIVMKNYKDICHEKLKKILYDNTMVSKSAIASLSKGYKVKTFLFSRWPGLYLFIYHFHKYLK